MDLPQFKYHPNVYNLDIFDNEEGICSVCRQHRTMKYNSSFYSVEEPDYICPWCIHDGTAAKKFNGEFNDYASIEGVFSDPQINSTTKLPNELLLEISERTPSYTSWQQEVWLTHCNEPCAFIDYADSDTIKPFLSELDTDIKINIGYDPEFILNHLTKEGSLVGYLFQCVKCGQHRLHADCD